MAGPLLSLVLHCHPTGSRVWSALLGSRPLPQVAAVMNGGRHAARACRDHRKPASGPLFSEGVSESSGCYAGPQSLPSAQSNKLPSCDAVRGD